MRQLIEALKRDGIGGNAIESINITISGGVVHGVVGAKDVRIGNLSFELCGQSAKGLMQLGSGA